jgi:small subunit ribosomal protein S4e
MHLKRSKADKKWPIPRKGTKFVVANIGNPERSIPLLVALRDMLKIGQNRKEVESILNKGEIVVNGKIRRDEKFSMQIYDILKIKSSGKIFMLAINKHQRFDLVEVKKDEKISKIIGKKKLKGNKTQISLIGGENFIVKENLKIGDSAVINFAKKSIDKVIPLKQGSEVGIICGSYIGQTGKITEIKDKVAEVSIKDKKLNIELKNLIAI